MRGVEGGSGGRILGQGACRSQGRRVGVDGPLEIHDSCQGLQLGSIYYN